MPELITQKELTIDLIESVLMSSIFTAIALGVYFYGVPWLGIQNGNVYPFLFIVIVWFMEMKHYMDFRRDYEEQQSIVNR